MASSILVVDCQLLLWIVIGAVSSVCCLEQQCERLTHSECRASAGYNFTAPFSPIDGKPFQEAKGKELAVYLPLLKQCSKYSATILCSLYFPKCVPGVPRPVLPCRSVCNDFVHKCSKELNLAAMHGMWTALCDLLPEDSNDNMSTQACFLPDGFNKSQAMSGVDKNVCHKVGIQQCTDDLHYNSTFVTNTTQSLSNLHLLQVIIGSKCSPNAEKFTCFTRFPPCFDGNKTKVQIPCKSLCTVVKSACKDVFKKNNIPESDCDFLYPDNVSPTGLCTLSTWPSPWQRNRIVTPVPPVCPTMPVPTSYPECKKCAPVTIEHCKNAGYTKTFHFNDLNDKPYQEVKAKALSTLPLLAKCSTLSQTILCSIYVPKCDELTCSSKPVLPCRHVCHQFLNDCETELRLAALHGLMVGLCDLLPSECTMHSPCLIPPGFKQTSGAYQRGICFPISDSHNTCAKDLHYNRTFLTPQDQMKVKYHLLQPIVDSKCSPNVERFFCYSRIPPCNSNSTNTSVALPCRSMCNKVLQDCSEVFKRNSIPQTDCDFLPEDQGVNGMCLTSTFPIPLRHIRNKTHHTKPNKGRKDGPNAGLIVGIAVAITVVAILVLIAGIVCFRWKKHKDPFEPKELHNIEGKET